jgi:DNA-directed RNA polymerase specialized sigma24 family protein
MTAVTAYAPCEPTREDVEQRCDEPVVIDLVARARGGDKRAWDALVERYAPLIWSICRQYRLGRADADDVGQNFWLRLVDHLDQIRDPAALPGWLATTTRRECGRLVRAAHGHNVALYRSTPRPSRTSRPRRPTRTCSRPNATRRCARHSPTCPQRVSS